MIKFDLKFANYNKQMKKIKEEVEKNFKCIGKKFLKRQEKFIMVKKKMNPYMVRLQKKSEFKEGIPLIRLIFEKNKRKKFIFKDTK